MVPNGPNPGSRAPPAGEACESSAAPGDRGRGRRWYLWVEDGLLVLGAVVLLAVAIRRWRYGAQDRTGEVVLYVDLSVMALLCVMRFVRFVRTFAATSGGPREGT